MAWPALHRQGGTVMVSTQTGAMSGDASRDLAAAWLLAAAADEGHPVAQVPTPTTESPRLQDLIDPDVSFDLTLFDGFGFWVGDTELDDESAASLEAANASVVPTCLLYTSRSPPPPGPADCRAGRTGSPRADASREL